MTTAELKAYFATAVLPKTAKLPSCNISNVKKLVKSHLRYLESTKSEKFAKPYKARLVELKNFIEYEN